VEAAPLIDWESEESHVLLNPRMPEEERRLLQSYVVDLPGHLWLATSGTTGALKLTALSKRAMLASAAAVNRHLQSDRSDVWCCVLPTFHVGGLGIYARAFLSGARVIPAQVRDLVSAGLRAPRQLRAIVVGGGALDTALYNDARELGWQVLPSYGMTETCSQVATATLGSPELVLLDHLECRTEENGRLAFRGESLLTGYGTGRGFVDPKIDGWFVTEDLGSVDGARLIVEGRRGDFIKIGGESVDLARLDAILGSVAGPQAAVVAVSDARLGHVIHLAVTPAVDGDVVRAAFDERVHPFERARRVHVIPEIPRSSLGKLLRKQLLEQLPQVVE
jgi:O-succinylbenzoic acid--CoA ligase